MSNNNIKIINFKENKNVKHLNDDSLNNNDFSNNYNNESNNIELKANSNNKSNNLEKNKDDYEIINNNEINRNNSESKNSIQQSNNNVSNNETVNLFGNSNTNNNSNNSKMGFFKDDEPITIENSIALDEKNIEYDNDIVYFQELENQLLSSYPVTKQKLKYIQELVENRVKSLIQLKNESKIKYKMLKENISYPLMYDIIQNKMNHKSIIPIVLDKHVVFTNVKVKNNDNINNNEDANIQEEIGFISSFEDPSGIHEESQQKLINMLNQNKLDFEEQKINLQEFLVNQSQMYKSYQKNFENNLDQSGFVVKTTNNNLVLRYHDLFNSQWNTYNKNDDFTTPVNIYDEDGKIKGTKQEVLIPGENMVVVGFMILSNGGQSILNNYNNIYGSRNYANYLYKVLYDTLEIANIEQDSKGIKIVLSSDNIQIDDDDVLYIDESNSYPCINGVYGTYKKFTVIDQNTILLHTKKKLKLTGNKGCIYKVSKLKYDLYNVQEDLNLHYLRSNYENQEESNDHNKIYLFKDISLSKEKYDNIIKKVLPSLDEIISLEYEQLKNVAFMEQANNILKNYHLHLNDLHVQQGKFIKEFLDKNMEAITSSFSITKNNSDNTNSSSNLLKTIQNYHYNNIQFLKEHVNYIISNQHVQNEEIIKYYGSYSGLDKNYDSLLNRYQWLINQKDHGFLFYLHFLNQSENKKTSLIKDIQTLIEKYETNLKSIQQNYVKNKDINKEKKNCELYKYQAIEITQKDIDKGLKHICNSNNDNCYVFFDTQLYTIEKNTLKEVENIPSQSKLLVNHNIWSYESKSKKWIYEDKYSSYEKLKYVCNFRNLEIDQLELDELDCIYKKDTGCQSKTASRFQNKIDELTHQMNLLQQLKSYLSSNEKTKEINEKTNQIIEKYFYRGTFTEMKQESITKIKEQKEEEKNKENPISNYVSTPLQKLVYNIRQLNNSHLIDSLFFELIHKDGLLVGNNIYSKKYNEKYTICGHYFYKKNIYYSSDANMREKFIQLLLATFSDDGEAEQNNLVCKHCGEYLMNNDYDETEGFTEEGTLSMSRQKWSKEEWKQFSETENRNLDQLLSSKEQLDCESSDFKSMLRAEGLDGNNLEEAISICTFITKNLYNNMGIILANGDLIQVIIESMQQIVRIAPFAVYKQLEKKKLQEQKISEAIIQKMEAKGIFEDNYKKQREYLKQSIICARLLITIQTIVPELVLKKRTSSCSFSGFENPHGINFSACILQELHSDIPRRRESEQQTLLDFFKKSIQKYYDIYINNAHIRELFKVKHQYKQSMKKNRIHFQENKDYDIYPFDKIPKPINPNSFLKDLTQVSNSNQVAQLKSTLKYRNLYLMNQIMSIIDEVIGQSPISDKHAIVHMPSSCCAEEALQYLNFYHYFQLENDQIKSYIEETNALYSLFSYFNNSGVFHRFYLYDPKKFAGCYNPIIVYDGKNASEKFKTSVLLTYVDKGEYKGTRREFLSSDPNAIDIKSNKTRATLEEEAKTFTIEDLNTLLKDVEQQTLEFYNPKINFHMDEATLQELKDNAMENIQIQLKFLLQNTSQLLNLNQNFNQKYENIIMSIGIYNIQDKLQKKDTKKEKVKLEEQLYLKKLDYFQKFYINTFKKNLSFIKNQKNLPQKNISLKFMDNPEDRREMQKDIGMTRDKILHFVETVQPSSFVDNHANYSNQEITSIVGKNNIYDKDYQSIIKYSDLTNNDASNILLFILLDNLNQFYAYIDEKNYTLDPSKEKYNQDIARFVHFLLEIIEEDYELFELCNQKNEIQNSMLYDYLMKKSFFLAKDGEDTENYYVQEKSEPTTIKEDFQDPNIPSENDEENEDEQNMEQGLEYGELNPNAFES